MTAVGKKGRDETPAKPIANEAQPNNQSVQLNTASHKAGGEGGKKSKCC